MISDGKESIDRGWLHEETEIHLRLHSSPVKMFKSKYRQQNYRIKCTPIDLLNRDVSENDITLHNLLL